MAEAVSYDASSKKQDSGFTCARLCIEGRAMHRLFVGEAFMLDAFDWDAKKHHG